jgi:hypothetical protein
MDLPKCFMIGQLRALNIWILDLVFAKDLQDAPSCNRVRQTSFERHLIVTYAAGAAVWNNRELSMDYLPHTSHGEFAPHHTSMKGGPRPSKFPLSFVLNSLRTCSHRLLQTWKPPLMTVTWCEPLSTAIELAQVMVCEHNSTTDFSPTAAFQRRATRNASRPTISLANGLLTAWCHG